jgi:hypothetical protein
MTPARFNRCRFQLCCDAEKPDRPGIRRRERKTPMTAITLHSAPGIATGTRAGVPSRRAAAPAPGLLKRAWNAVIRARMRQVERELALHQHLLPTQLDLVGDRLSVRSEKDLPFVR